MMGPRDSKRIFSYIVDFVIEPEVCAPEGSRFPSRAGASGSHHLPWALPRILQVRAKRKRVGDGNNPGVGRGGGVACSKGASNAFIPARRVSAIAGRTAGRRRGSGRVGRPSSDTGR